MKQWVRDIIYPQTVWKFPVSPEKVATIILSGNGQTTCEEIHAIVENMQIAEPHFPSQASVQILPEVDPMNKIHFKDSLERLTEGTDIVANCGVLIPKAKFGLTIDFRMLGLQEISGINNCKDCLTGGEKIEERHLLYGITAGQESMSREGEAA